MEWRMNEWKRNEAWNEPINKNTHQKTHLYQPVNDPVKSSVFFNGFWLSPLDLGYNH